MFFKSVSALVVLRTIGILCTIYYSSVGCYSSGTWHACVTGMLAINMCYRKGTGMFATIYVTQKDQARVPLCIVYWMSHKMD